MTLLLALGIIFKLIEHEIFKEIFNDISRVMLDNYYSN